MSEPDDHLEAIVDELAADGVVPSTPAADEERVRRIATEAARAFDALRGIGPAATIFGSAQETAVERWGGLASDVAAELVEADFGVITGGGPGLMAAANEGAYRGGGPSVGLTIDLPAEESPNEFLTLRVPFYYFFLRKLCLVKYACAFVLLPGGFGTLDELFEALNLRRTRRLAPFPVILVDSGFWSGLLDWLRSGPVAAGNLTQADLDMIEVTDDPRVVRDAVAEGHATLCRRLGVHRADPGDSSEAESRA